MSAGIETHRGTSAGAGACGCLVSQIVTCVDRLASNGRFSESVCSGDAILALQDLGLPDGGFRPRLLHHPSLGRQVAVPELCGQKLYLAHPGRTQCEHCRTEGMDAVQPRAGVHYPRFAGEFQSWFSTDTDCLDYLDWLR